MSNSHTSRWSMGVFLILLCVVGCSRRSAWERPLSAVTSEDFAASRDKLVAELSQEQLQSFDTAIQELKLEAMNRGVAGTDAREQEMRAIVNGKSAAEATLLGWRARRDRVQRELKDMNERLAHDSGLADRPGTNGSSKTVANLIQNEQDIINQLHKQLTETEQRISTWETSTPKR